MAGWLGSNPEGRAPGGRPWPSRGGGRYHRRCDLAFPPSPGQLGLIGGRPLLNRARTLMIAFDFDPCEVLGVGPTASLQEIRDAYRARSKLYHPDTGGEAWAFRVICRAYESLSQARVVSRAQEDGRRASPETASPRADPVRVPAAGRGGHATGRHRSRRRPVATGHGRNADRPVRGGQRPFPPPPARRGPQPELHPQGPVADRGAGPEARRDRRGRAIPAGRQPRFDGGRGVHAADLSRSSIEDGRFSGWLTYPTVAPVSEALQRLRSLLTPEGMGVQHTIRDHHVPRDWVG